MFRITKERHFSVHCLIIVWWSTHHNLPGVRAPLSKEILLKIVDEAQWKMNGFTSTICRKIPPETGPRITLIQLATKIEFLHRTKFLEPDRDLDPDNCAGC